MEEFMTTAFWVAVGQIIMIDILLGGDNAVVIALACRNLPDKQRKQGIILGTIGAIVLRVILIAFALALLAIPYLKIVGGVLLFWIGIQLMQPEGEEEHNINPSDKLWSAVKTVIVADLVMSVDNVLAIAGAAQGAGQQHQLPLVIFGLLVSIPIIVWGSQIVLKLMERFPIIITAGAMLLGWIAGQMIYTDPAMVGIRPEGKIWEYTFAAVGALVVLLIGQVLQKRAKKAPPAA
jgi:YjbE family integral membrane protein